MHRLTRLLILATFAVCWLGCGEPPDTGSASEDLITVCLSGPCTITAQPPASSVYMWQPTWAITPIESTQRMCSPAAPPVAGEIAIFDKAMVQDAAGNWYWPAGTQCGVLKDSAGGWFDWDAFQNFGWATSTNTSIRSLQLGPGTDAVFSERPLDLHRPEGCALDSNCVGVGGETFVRFIHDVRTTFPQYPSFYMASLHITRQ